MGKPKIYTKSGDRGKTGLIGGTRVLKSDERLVAYGTIDELNSHLGMIRSYPMEPADHDFIVFLQKKLFTVGANLATDQEAMDLMPEARVSVEDIERIENKIDDYESDLPIMTHFILPGGHPQVSAIHIARTVCRRAERQIVKLSESLPIDEKLIQVINRMSDYLFVLSRVISKKVNCEEIPWEAS